MSLLMLIYRLYLLLVIVVSYLIFSCLRLIKSSFSQSVTFDELGDGQIITLLSSATITTSCIHSRLDYCDSLTLSRLEWIAQCYCSCFHLKTYVLSHLCCFKISSLAHVFQVAACHSA
jgi:hypothetical protein